MVNLKTVDIFFGRDEGDHGFVSDTDFKKVPSVPLMSVAVILKMVVANQAKAQLPKIDVKRSLEPKLGALGNVLKLSLPGGNRPPAVTRLTGRGNLLVKPQVRKL
jgi:hypothetical protein